MGSPVGRNGVDAAGGVINGARATKVKVNGSVIVTIGDAVASHSTGPHTSATMAVGSTTVFAQGIGVCRADDAATCGHTLTPGSASVRAG